MALNAAEGQKRIIFSDRTSKKIQSKFFSVLRNSIKHAALSTPVALDAVEEKFGRASLDRLFHNFGASESVVRRARTT